MRELSSILKAWRAAEESGTEDRLPAVLATVVHVKGSAYRRPGARMLMLPDGTRIGSISGGCLEGDIVKKAWWLTDERRSVLRTYDTTSGDDAIWEFGLGCNGVVDVLLERIDTDSARRAMEFLESCERSRQAGVLATVIRVRGENSAAEVGHRLFVDAAWQPRGELSNSVLKDDILEHIGEVFDVRKSRLVQLRECDVFLEWVGPPLPLVIFGGGHDAIPLVAIAKEMGWHVTVADGRAAYAQRQRLALADEVILLPAAVPIASDSVVVLMTHNYPQDRELLRAILPQRPRYLGLLGPKARTERLLTEVLSEVTAEVGASEPDLYAPIGLDIGADTPEAIALSIVAEIQAVIAGRSAGMLRDRRGAIYDPVRVH